MQFDEFAKSQSVGPGVPEEARGGQDRSDEEGLDPGGVGLGEGLKGAHGCFLGVLGGGQDQERDGASQGRGGSATAVPFLQPGRYREADLPDRL